MNWTHMKLDSYEIGFMNRIEMSCIHLKWSMRARRSTYGLLGVWWFHAHHRPTDRVPQINAQLSFSPPQKSTPTHALT